MRFVQPEPRIARKDITSRSYDINIRVSGVDSVLIERLTVKSSDICELVQNIYSLQQQMRIRTILILHVHSAIQRQTTSSRSKNITVFGTHCHALARRKTLAIELCTLTQGQTRPSMILNFGDFEGCGRMRHGS